MPLVFQYGSNCTAARLNSPRRLNGRAKDLGRAKTVENFDIAFDVWSQTNGCAASDLIATPRRTAWGVLYSMSKKSLARLKAIEGPRYEPKLITIIDTRRRRRTATTFVVKEDERRQGLATSAAYVSWIVYGLRDHGVPESYITHVVDVAIETNRRAREAADEQTRIIETL